MSQAFISYHRAQSKLARLIAHRVAADGHSVWWDRAERPGDNWSEAVSTALANSACVIVIWSRQALASPFVLGEATAGFGRGALVNVLADGVPAPSPFDRAPSIDMTGWAGESGDLAWIRLREPLRAKLQAAEIQRLDAAPIPAAPAHTRNLQASLAVNGGNGAAASMAPTLGAPPLGPPPAASSAAAQVLPPQPRPAPIRSQYAPTAPLTPPTPYRESRGGVAISTLFLLAVGGLGAAGWYFRDDLNATIDQWRAAQEQDLAPEESPIQDAAVAPSQIAPIPPAPMANGEAPPTETDALAVPDPATAGGAPAAAPSPAAPSPADARSRAIAEAPKMTYDWRDSYVPPPVLRTAPARPPEPAVARASAPAATNSVAEPVVSPPPPAGRAAIALRQGRFIDLDPVGPRHETDIYFAPDRNGYGLFLGVANGARIRTARPARLSARACESGVLRRNPIPARELEQEGGVCVRTSEGKVLAWRVERIDRDKTGAVLVLQPVDG